MVDQDLLEFKRLEPRIKERDGFKCVRCHTPRRLTIHHLKPRLLGGLSEERNLVTLCFKCHNFVEQNDPTWDKIKTKLSRVEKKKCCEVKWSRNEFGLVAEHTHYV